MLTQDQIDAIKSDIDLAAGAASPFVAMLGPEALAALAIARAVAKEMPATVKIIQRWAGGQKPTMEEEAAFNAELKVLADPDLP